MKKSFKSIIALILTAVIVTAFATTGVCAAKFVSNANITVTAPMTDTVASKSVTASDSADYEVVKVLWQDIDDNHRILEEGETFKAGHVYVLGISLRALNGKIFSEERSTVTVNDGRTDWWVEGGTDGIGEIAIINHTFPKTPAGYATNLSISDVDAPVTGQSPDWDVSCDWDGVTVTTVGWQCIESGESVFSFSDQSLKDEYVFRAGYTYRFAVVVEVKDDYELYGFFSATVNGEYTDSRWNVEGKSAVVEYTFPTCEDVVPEYIPGDANSDGKVNIQDASLILKHFSGWDVEIDTEAADVNDDEKINMKDATLIVKFIAGWNIELK